MGECLVPLHDKGPQVPLVGLGKEEEDQNRPQDQAPFPVDGRLVEDFVVDVGDVEGREEGEDAETDGQGERLVVPGGVGGTGEGAGERRRGDRGG